MSPRHRALDLLRGWSPPEAEQGRLCAAYVDHLNAHADGLLKACYPRHLTAGLLVLSEDGEEVLLNLHGKAGRWFAFGGHIEEDDPDLAAAALREGTEESGIPAAVLAAGMDPSPVHLSRHEVGFCSPRGPVVHLDVRFVAVVPAGTTARRSAESHDVRWWSFDRLPTDEPDVLGLIDLARRRR